MYSLLWTCELWCIKVFGYLEGVPLFFKDLLCNLYILEFSTTLTFFTWCVVMFCYDICKHLDHYIENLQYAHNFQTLANTPDYRVLMVKKMFRHEKYWDFWNHVYWKERIILPMSILLYSSLKEHNQYWRNWMNLWFPKLSFHNVSIYPSLFCTLFWYD